MENQLTKNFTLRELTYSSTAEANDIDNTPGTFEYNNLKRLCEEVLQPVREKWGKPITVNSRYRSPQLNSKLKGSATSQHCKGEAADIDCENNERLFNIIISMINNNEIEVGQLIDEKKYSWIHISLPYHKKNQVLHL